MSQEEGKIIAIVGAPATGKSSLARHFKDNYDVLVFLEGEENDLPEYVKQNLKENKNNHQTILFFHNQSLRQYHEALQHKEKGLSVILDTFWLSNIFFLDSLLPHQVERDLFEELIELTNRSIQMPDAIVYFHAPDSLISERLASRGRSFEEDFLATALKINKAHHEYFGSESAKTPIFEGTKILRVNANDVDFEKIAEELKLKRKK